MTAIEFNNISKQYRLGLVSTRTISHDLNRWWAMNIRGKEDPYLKIGDTNDRSTKGESDYVWALRDIDFKVEQGDVLGIIGKNGAGKSTLLKILSKVTTPTTGTIKARGRIASLLEVGTGFHPEMTGRENIYMNGAIMGMSKAEITRKLDEIVDFSGVERYLDTPVKRYSSGMTVRLGFAIAAHLDPEILVVDEVLAVGDAEFQKKAIGKMQDVSRGEGRTVLFVSHNMASLRMLCNRGILIDKGSVFSDGGINEICDLYLKQSITHDNVTSQWSQKFDSSKAFQLLESNIKGENDNKSTLFSCDEDILLELDVFLQQKVPGLYGYLEIQKTDGTSVWVSDSNDLINNKLERLEMGENKIRLTIPKRTLAAGEYLAYLNFTSDFSFTNRNIDTPGIICKFSLSDTITPRGDKRQGYFSKLIDWKF